MFKEDKKLLIQLICSSFTCVVCKLEIGVFVISIIKICLRWFKG